jgi:hypothetical protein
VAEYSRPDSVGLVLSEPQPVAAINPHNPIKAINRVIYLSRSLPDTCWSESPET